jgi:hypothetical protein
MNILNKILLSLAMTASLASTSVMAATVLPDFTVDPSLGGTTTDQFVADKITGNYAEVVTFSATNPGTFEASIKWQAGQFVADDGTNPLLASTTQLGNNYALYGLFQGSGTFSTVGGVTTFLFSSSAISIYYNALPTQTTFTAPVTGNLPWVPSQADTLLATGTQSGGGNTSSNGGILNGGCGGANCGSFGVTNNFLLTAAGSTFFVAPPTFYNITLGSGQFNLFTPTPGTTQTTNGSADFTFRQVPEPGSLALIGIGLTVLGLRARKQI